MKKYFFVGLFILLLFPCVVNAKEYCKVISGEGINVGTELACGTEHFYIVETKNNTVKMLAKYNLNVGDKIDYFELNEQSAEDNKAYCRSKATEKGYHAYYVYPMVENPGNFQNPGMLFGCRVYEKLSPEHVQQDERAIGTKLDGNGKSILPLYGITYMNPEWGYEAIVNNDLRNNEYDSKGDLIVSGTVFEDYLNGYKTELQRQEVSVSDVSFITLERTINLLKKISNKEVELNLEYEDPSTIGNPFDNPEAVHIGKMDIKDYVPNNHKWIYGVTYWLGSGFKNENSVPNRYNDYYITNEGVLCALGRGICSYFAYPIGNGVRPLVTISSEDIQYLIRTKTDGHGTIEVIDHASGGDSIKFRINSNKGYKLDSITIVTDAGEKVSFKEGEIQKNSDGTMSIDKNNFTMPFDNVTIEARWKSNILNPNTGVEALLMIMLILVSTITMTVIIKRKEIEE